MGMLSRMRAKRWGISSWQHISPPTFGAELTVDPASRLLE